MVGTVVKSKIGKLGEEVREGSLRKTRKDFTGVVKGVLDKNRLLLMFQYGCENNMPSNRFTIVIVYKIPEEKEPEVSAIPEIPKEQVELDKRYHFCDYGMLRF